MTRMVLVAVVTLASLMPAMAQDFTPEQRAACKGTLPGGGRILACLRKHDGALSAACKKVVADAQKK